jgi:hypothetical protein
MSKRLRTGLRNITVAYAQEGYVDMTAAPDFEIDKAHEPSPGSLRSIGRCSTVSEAQNFSV